VVDIENQEVTAHLLENGQYQKTTKKEDRLISQEISGFFIETQWIWKNPLPSTFECLKEIWGM
jgi:hypothetical protein